MSNKRKSQASRSFTTNSAYRVAQLDRPRLVVEGSARLSQAPESGKIDVTITGTATTASGAWAHFQERLVALRTALDGVATLGSAVPTESTSESQKALRTVTEYTVTANVTVGFLPEDFGHILKPLVEGRYKFGSPTFAFDSDPQATPELLGEASSDARQRAELVAAGVGAVVGRLVNIKIGKAQANVKLQKSWVDYLFRQNSHLSWNVDNSVRSLLLRNNNPAPSAPELVAGDFAIQDGDIETVDSVVYITAEFELVYPTEVAA